MGSFFLKNALIRKFIPPGHDTHQNDSTHTSKSKKIEIDLIRAI